jgi:glycine C-acetyltransferase
MAYTSLQHLIQTRLDEIRSAGLFKNERQILGPQGAQIPVLQGEVINFCANNYLGLANHPDIIHAAEEGLHRYGFGMASVRFICGTQDQHKHLEENISRFLGTGDTILYSSCFDANTGFFETLLSEQDAVISDALNHASLIDGIRLCKAKRFRYAHADMHELEAVLQQAAGSRVRVIATDGVFSMDGDLARLDRITELADRHDALVLVDDSHATGVLGRDGKGTPEHFGVAERVDIVTSTLGKALGGGAGGFTSGRREIIALLRQHSRPYLFSNALPPVITAAALKALEIVIQGDDLRTTLSNHSQRFRSRMEALGFRLVPGNHPIIPVMLGDAELATRMAERLLEEGIYVIGFSFPVVPKGQARIRVQLSAAHTQDQVDRALQAFKTVGRELKVIS